MTDSDTDTDIDEESTLDMDMDELASTVLDHMDPGQTIGDKIVLSRRQLLAIAGGGLSLGALGTFGVSDAQAQTAVGTIGTASSPVDVEAAQVNANQLGTASNPVDVEAATANAQTVNTEKIGNGRFYADGFSGADPDTRLDNAITAANSGDVIFLENATYSDDLTVSSDISLIGTKPARSQNTTIDANWTLTSKTRLENVTLKAQSTGDVLTIDGDSANLMNIFGSGSSSIQVNGDELLATHLERVAVVFDSATADGLVDSSILVSVSGNITDNEVGNVT